MYQQFGRYVSASIGTLKKYDYTIDGATQTINLFVVTFVSVVGL